NREISVGKTWAKETTSRPTKRLIEAPTKKTLEYWSGLRKATGSILMQLRTGRISLGTYLNRTNRRETARCGCDLGNQTVSHVLLECPLHQDERDWMRSALSNQGGAALHRDKLLTRSEARTIVAEFMVETGLLGQFQEADPTALGVEEGDDKGAEIDPLGQCDGRRRMAPIRSAVPGPLYSLDPSERASGSRRIAGYLTIRAFAGHPGQLEIFETSIGLFGPIPATYTS
ncbi:hypothetical protein N7467_001970, partial [Penicillium canescens]